MHNLAVTPNTFIGRSQEIEEIGALLDDPSCRLLTLVGHGGIGKTRLALEVAARKSVSFPDGDYFVPLAPLCDADDILTAIADAMPFQFQQDNRDPREQFLAYLSEKHAKHILLVIDNFEHVLDGVDIISEILATTTNLKILVTSREALNLQEEWTRQISGLAYPDHENGTPLSDFSAVQLFLDHARRIRGDFDLTDDSRSIVEICRLVEGMPLAIELAAGWLKTLQPADIAHEIQNNMDILATRSRNLPERHRSIRSVFSHSWELLLKEERDVFRKLSVFRGGFTREAAEVVADASLYLLAGLVDKSLVRLSTSGRYDVHELLRQFGVEQLEAADQTAAVQQAYIEYYLGMLHRLEGDIKAHHQITSLDAIAVDYENIRNAWQIATQQGHFAVLNDAVESLHFFADMRGRYPEVVALLRQAVERFPQLLSPELEPMLRRIQARLIRLILLGNIRIEQDLRAQIDTCLAVARAHQDQSEIGYCLMVAGIVAFWEADNKLPFPDPRAVACFEESSAIFEALGDLFYAADSIAWLAPCSVPTRDYDPSIAILQHSLELRTEIGDRNGIAWVTLNLAVSMEGQLNYVECERYTRQALTLMREISSLKGILHAMFKLSELVTLKGDLDEALAIVEEMREQSEEANNLDGKMMSAGLMAFLSCIIDENYEKGLALAHQNYTLSLEPFFGGHNVMAARFGQAVAACGLGDFQTARQDYNFQDWEQRDDPTAGTVCLAIEAAALAHDGDFEHAAELLALAFHQPAWASGWLHHWALLDRLRAELNRQLGEDAFQAAWERGSQLDLETTIRSLLGELDDAARPIIPAKQSLLDPLSERELEVLSLIADGLSNRDIAERLYLSVGTIKVHTRNIYGKLNVNSRTQALARATEINLL
ncbi:MAG: AAA family ATPase [Burkholderiales bacterium]|nr:AAA family ATPase [Anaerolineae bacterium]